MGYTHYFDNGTFDFSDKFLEDVAKIIECGEKHGIELCSDVYDGHDFKEVPGATIDRESVSFNGANGQDCETFRLISKSGLEAAYTPEEIRDFARQEFCKTAQRPYDSVACAVLLRAKEENPEMSIESDGTFLGDWQSGRELFAEAMGHEAACPEKMTLATVYLKQEGWSAEILAVKADRSAAIWGSFDSEMTKTGKMSWSEVPEVLAASGIDLDEVNRSLVEECGMELDEIITGDNGDKSQGKSLDEMMSAKTSEAELGDEGPEFDVEMDRE